MGLLEINDGIKHGMNFFATQSLHVMIIGKIELPSSNWWLA